MHQDQREKRPSALAASPAWNELLRHNADLNGATRQTSRAENDATAAYATGLLTVATEELRRRKGGEAPSGLCTPASQLSGDGPETYQGPPQPYFGGTQAYYTQEEEENDLNKSLLHDLKGPLEHRWNWYPILLLLWFMGSGGYYFFVRSGQCVDGYTTFIFVAELLGVSSFLPYAILLTRGIYPSGSSGLPPAEDDKQKHSPTPPSPFMFPSHTADGNRPTRLSSEVRPEPWHMEPPIPETPAEPHRFHVRVMVPCYKEPLDVIKATVNAARNAALPARTRRTIYLCDDGKSADKKAFVESLGPDVVYVSGRKRKTGEINGKSANLNNAFKNVIYADYPKNSSGNIDWRAIGNEELIVVFDADMCAKYEFFLRLLEVMADESYALVLSPQAFHNISPDADLFNNINKQFWECWLPGAFAWGYIACTGTNFCLRARALAHCGWFPEYTITEDYALGMELKSHGYRATYYMMNLAEGEAPDEIRNVFRQRSRWTKGHFQVFFSPRCPLLNFGLPFFQRLWYSYAAWAPICTIVTLPVFMVVPFMSIVFGVNPVIITFDFVLSSTLYYCAMAVILHYAYAWGDWKLIWFANGSNTVLWFTYTKALFNSFVAKLGFKVVAFKVTEKAKPMATADATPPPPLATNHSMMSRLMRALTPRRMQRQEGPLLPNKAANSTVAETRSISGVDAGTVTGALDGKPPVPRAASATHSLPPMPLSLPSGGAGANPGQTVLVVQKSAAFVRGANPLPGNTEAGKKSGWKRFKGVVASFKPAHIKEFDEMFDPLVLFLLFLFCSATFAFGIWQTAHNFHDPTSNKLALNSPIKGSPYLVIATLWAFFNCIMPYLFLHYCFTAEATFKWAVNILMFLSQMVLVCSIILLWLLIPAEFSLKTPLHMQTTQYYPAQVSTDGVNTFQFVQGSSASAVVWPTFDRGYITEMQAALANGGRGSSRRLHDSHASQKVPAGSDPAALADAELHSGEPVATWQRSLLQSVPDAEKSYQGLPDGFNLGGGLLVRDHVKYNMPIAYTITQLAWSLLQYPKGYSKSESDSLLKIIRSGSEYLIRCLMRTEDGRYMYVAQVGDPDDYVVAPGMQNLEQRVGKPFREWTSMAQDSYMIGDRVRKVWLLDEDHVGADLLGNVAAALAATSLVMRKTDLPYSNLALKKAALMYKFATLDTPALPPRSYCDFVPCFSTIQVQSEQKVVPILGPIQDADPQAPTCYYVESSMPTCMMYHTEQECQDRKNKDANTVFAEREGCCNYLRQSKEWQALKTGAQGICAIPFSGQKECFLPDLVARTCNNETLNDWTGEGCARKQTEVFATAGGCCNYILQNLPAGSAGSGMCADHAADGYTCYAPNKLDLTCDEKKGYICNMPGATVYGLLENCCSDITDWALQRGLQPREACQAPSANATQDTCFVQDWRNATCIFTSGPICQSPTEKKFTTELNCCNSLIQWALDNNLQPTGRCRLLAAQRLPNVTRPQPRQRRQRRLQQAPTPAAPPAGLWQPAQSRPTGLESCQQGQNCLLKQVVQDSVMQHYPNSAVYDDLAWAAVWMYKATGDHGYVGAAERFLEQHQQEVSESVALTSDRTYYLPGLRNLAWATNLLLMKATNGADIRYEQKIKMLLETWVFGKNVWREGSPGGQSAGRLQVSEAVDASDNTKSYFVIPQCTPTEDTEKSCDDKVDNDCDGLIDKEDPDCGVWPVIYTPKGLAAAGNRTLPNAAAAAWLAIVYADAQPDNARAKRLRCWALSQVEYMIGEAPGVRSYLVGYNGGPSIIQHRDSSCPATSASGITPKCNWINAFWPALPNPQLDLVKGALVAGPDVRDQFVEDRANQQTQVTLDGTAALTSVLAGLVSTGTTLHACEMARGLYQRLYVDNQVL